MIVAMLFLLSGCAVKQIQKSETVAVVWKTKSLKFIGTGFLQFSGSKVELSVYSTGVPVLKMRLGKNVCIENNGCLSYKSFNRRFLHPSYPQKLIYNLFMGKPLFHGANLHRTKRGFEQRIANENFDIIYRFNLNEIYFKDKKNKILVKIRKLNG